MGNEKYVVYVVRYLVVFFFDEVILMNFSFFYVQVIKGKVMGCGIGIIDIIYFIEVVKVIEVLVYLGYL